MASSVNDLVGPAEASLAALLRQTTNQAIKTKLTLMNAVCRAIVTKGKRLTIADVVRKYDKARTDEPMLAESTIRNKRERGNPYMDLYGAWETVAHEVHDHLENGRKRHSNGDILTVKETLAIDDISLRHRTAQLIVRAKGLQKELDLLRAQFSRQASVIIAPPEKKAAIAGGERHGIDLTQAEAEAVRTFLQKLDDGVLRKTADDGIRINNGPYVADSGFVSALTKVLDAADPIPF